MLFSDFELYVIFEQFFFWFEVFGIVSMMYDYVVVFIVEELKVLCGDILGVYCKNFFLCNKKGKMWFVVCLESLWFDFKVLGVVIGVGWFFFVSVECFEENFGVMLGLVMLFVVINDYEGKVDVVFVELLLSEEFLNFYLFVNLKMMMFSFEGLQEFLYVVEYELMIVVDDVIVWDD